MLGTKIDYQPTDSQLEIASLETDIMRFLAILAFCLMVIFALVQSLPVSSSQASIEQANRENMQLMLAVKSEQISVAALLLENEQLKQQTQINRQQLQTLHDRLQRQMQWLQTMVEALSKKEQQLRKLEAVRQQSQTQLESHRALLAKLAKEQEAARNAAAEARETAAHRPVHADEQKTTIQSTSGDEKKSFSLRFLSDQLFRRLVLTGLVDLYVQTDGEYRRYQQGSFVSQTFSGKLYAMDERTVPATFLGLAKSSMQGIQGWFVSLPENTVQEIERLLSANKPGDLLIVENAEVRLGG